MRTLVESLKRLYNSNTVALEKLGSLLSLNKITQEEYDYMVAI